MLNPDKEFVVPFKDLQRSDTHRFLTNPLARWNGEFGVGVREGQGGFAALHGPLYFARSRAVERRT